jgi:polysaccharide export outer membrane protein
MHRILLLLLAVFTGGMGPMAYAQAPAQPVANATSAPTPTLQIRKPSYRLRRGDTFNLDFAYTPEYNQTIAVGPDGYGSLKQVGQVYVEGKTIDELTAIVRTSYKNILHDPVIAVSLKDFEKPYFIATGQVGKPGKYDLRGPLTVTEGVALAGGFNDMANHSQVVLFHPVDGGQFETKLLNIKQLLASRNLNEDIYLQPGDLVYVPQSTISKIRKFVPSSSVGAFYNPASLF